MRIKYLKLKNFRGIHDLELHFHSRVNVLVGVNGSGKSSILDALGIMLSRVVSLLRSGKNSGRNIATLDISSGMSDSALKAAMTDEGGQCHGTYSWALSAALPGSPKKTKKSDVSKKTEVSEKLDDSEKKDVSHSEMDIKILTSMLRQKIEDSNEQCSVPVIIYYQTNRVALNFPKYISTNREFSLMSVYQDSLTSRADYKVLLEWFRERENAEDRAFRKAVTARAHSAMKKAKSSQKSSQKASKKIPASNREIPNLENVEQEFNSVKEKIQDYQLDAVRNAWSRFMPEFSHFTIEINPLRLEATKNGIPFRISQLSDGEKSLLAMVGDIARRLAIANPTLKDPLQGTGVVLIDEIDLHLHPKWQRMIIPRLAEVFPSCQFIVATHSPQILGHVRANSIFLLYENEDGLIECRQPEESYGMTTDAILEDLMEVPARDPDEEKKLLRLFELIERRKLDEAKKLVADIRMYRKSDPKLLTADLRIHRLEKIPSEHNNLE